MKFVLAIYQLGELSHDKAEKYLRGPLTGCKTFDAGFDRGIDEALLNVGCFFLVEVRSHEGEHGMCTLQYLDQFVDIFIVCLDDTNGRVARVCFGNLM